MLRRMFDDIVSKSVQRICNKHKMLVNIPELKEYIRVENSVEEKEGEDSIDLHTIVHSDPKFKKSQVSIGSVLQRGFDFVEQYSATLVPFLRIFMENSNIRWDEMEKQENDYFKKKIEEFHEEDN